MENNGVLRRHRATFGGIEYYLTRTEWERILGITATRLSSYLTKYNTMREVIDNAPELVIKQRVKTQHRNFCWPENSRFIEMDFGKLEARVLANYTNNVGSLK